jgi:3-phenylpropionate/trans-cinnamate dioxygenase ferredoxin reductase component
MESRYEYLVVGGGPTSVWAAQSIRETDKTGKILIVGADTHPPYDRPPLSKDFLVKDDMPVDDPYSKFDDFYPKNDIELRKGTRVTAIDRANRAVTLQDGATLGYDKLLLATGSRPRSIEVPGANRPGVHLLRSIEDALAIREALQQKPRVVIVGAGYLGMEVAASAKTRGLEVTVVETAAYPWAKFGSERLGKFLQAYYEKQGVKFVLNDSVTALEGEGENGKVSAVVTKGGQRLPADLVVVGVGVSLNTELAKDAGLDVDDRDGVRVNEFLKTSDPNIWAAGDIACFPDKITGKTWHAEHHLNAKWQGQAVGRIMAGGTDPYDRVAYFFSDEFDIHMILRGNPNAAKHSILTGDLEGAEFTELYYDDSGKLTMGISVSHEEKILDPISDTLEELIQKGVVIKGREAEIQKPGFDLASLASE